MCILLLVLIGPPSSVSMTQSSCVSRRKEAIIRVNACQQCSFTAGMRLGPAWSLLTVVCLGSVTRAVGLEVFQRNISGTETTSHITDKQLAIQRWFAQLTYLQNMDSWAGWGAAVDDLDCDGNTCIRYEIAGLAYAAAVLAYKTPAYTQVTEQILYNSILRMTKKEVWQYVELFDDFKEQPTYPDPVAYKNIMYSGHLAQMIALFESIFGNFTFSEIGWSFEWGADSDFPTPILYNTSKLMDSLYNQSLQYEIGGIPCEPDSIFIICNNYPMNAFYLHDALHGTNLATRATETWQSTVENDGLNRVPDLEKNDNNYFNLDYLIHPLGIWEPIGSIGSDVWALSWMRSWWSSDDSRSEDFLQNAFSSVYNSPQWNTTSAAPTEAGRGSELRDDSDDLYPQSFLHPGPGSKVFPFSDEITTSFYPMIEKQFSLHQTDGYRTASIVSKINDVYRYFENSMGIFFDSDGDGTKDSYQYNTELPSCQEGSLCETGNYSIWATANLLIAMSYPNNSPFFLKEIIQPSELPYLRNLRFPKVLSVEYPSVMVSKAHYEDYSDPNTLSDAESDTQASFQRFSLHQVAGALKFTINPGDNFPRLEHKVVVRGQFDKIIYILINGEKYNGYSKGANQNELLIRAPGWGICDQNPYDVVVLFTI